MSKQLIRVQTRNALYIVDRELNRWKRISVGHPRDDDNQWQDGGFTLGEIGSIAFAHYANRLDRATGRRTSTVISITETTAPEGE